MMYEPTSNTVATTVHGWNVVAARGSQGADPDVSVGRVGGCVLATSKLADAFVTDWVAFDTGAGRLPAGPYATRVTSDKFMIQFDNGGTLSTTQPARNQPVGITGSSWLVDVRDVTLTAGTTYTFKVTGGLDSVYVLGGASPVRTAGSLAPNLVLPPTDDPEVARTGTFTFKPTTTGRYGILFVRDIWVGAAASVKITTKR
jgi:hypothetical protein